MKRISILIIISMLLLCGCSETVANFPSAQIPDQTQDSPNYNEENGQMGYSYEIIEDSIKTNYDGNGPISFTYKIENYDVPIELGFIVFLNGIPQKTSIAADGDLLYMQKINFKKRETKKINFKFIPDNGCKGANRIYIASLLNPSFIPNSEQSVFGNNHKSEYVFFDVVFKNNIENSYSILNQESEELNTDVNTKEYLDADEYPYQFCYPGSNMKIMIFHTKDKQLEINLTSFGGKNLKYRQTVFLNHKPLNESLADIEFSNSKIFHRTLNIDLSNVETNDVILYSFSIPLEGEFGHSFAVKSNSVLIKLQ